MPVVNMLDTVYCHKPSLILCTCYLARSSGKQTFLHFCGRFLNKIRYKLVSYSSYWRFLDCTIWQTAGVPNKAHPKPHPWAYL